ncbi:MAG: FAD-dependent oxidoreductase [Solirubrobacterales bacterium]
MSRPVSRVLSKSQIDMLAEHGEEKTAAVGDVLFEVGDASYPFIAIREGEAAILDASGREIVRHGASGFLGEMNLLSGQTVFLTAVVTEPMRYVEVDRETLRGLLFEDGALSDLLLSAFVQRRESLQRVEGVGIEIVGPTQDHATRDLVEYAKRQRLPYSWRDPGKDTEAAELVAGLAPEEIPLVRLPGGADLRRPSNGELSRALGIGLELAPREEVDLLIVGGGPAGLGAAVYGASEGLNTLVVESNVLGGQAGMSRRIENYLGFPAGISGTELISRAITQARKFTARTATPYKALSLEPGGEGDHLVKLEGDREVLAKAVLLSTGAEYRKLPVDDLEDYEGLSVFYAAGPPEAQICGAQRVGVVGGGNSAAQAAVWLARGGALVTLLHRRANLAETMSAYLIDELDRYGVAVRDRSEITELHGSDGRLESVKLTDGIDLPLSFLFLFLGASPCTGWLGDCIARDEKGFILTGEDAGAEGLLETSVPGVYAAGDVRAGSIKRCATAVGEGATVVRFVHEHMNKVRADQETAAGPRLRPTASLRRAR